VEGETESVIRVATELDRLLAQANLAQAENRPLTLHLTLGRVRRGKKAPDLTAILSRIGAKEFGTVRVEDFVLMRSHLRPDGPLYQVICSFALTTGIAETREE
jgi:2'-5' RNA ligase